jgi:hypothetical protein
VCIESAMEITPFLCKCLRPFCHNRFINHSAYMVLNQCKQAESPSL